MNLEQFLLTLKARYKIVLIAVVVTIAAALASILNATKIYTATSAVVIDTKYADPIVGSILPAWTQPSFMATQLDIILSERVAAKVVQEQKLDQDPEARAEWEKATSGRGTLVSWLAGGLKGNLDVKPSKDSNVFMVNYRDPDPRMAATLANAFAQAYIDTNVELRVEPARQYSTYFVEQSRAARDRLEKAQSALSAFQQTNHIIVVNDEKMDVETSRLNELSSQLSSIQGQFVESQSRERQAKGSGDSMQEVLQNPLIQSLKGDLARQEARLQEMSGNLGVNNPRFKQAKSEIDSLRRKIAAETQQLTSGIGASNRVNAQREADIKASLEAQKARVLKLKQDRDSAAVLQRDVDAAQRAFDAVSQRTTQSNLESQANQTNIAILNRAIEPLTPSSPRVKVSLIIALFAGLLLGTGAALLIELIDRRVRSIDDLGKVLGMPVMGVIGRSQKPGRRLAGSRSLLPWKRDDRGDFPGRRAALP